MSAVRSSNSPSTVVASSRASPAPIQKCVPLPKVMCPLPLGRSSRNSSGSPKWAGSRLAAPHNSSSREPAGKGVPHSSVSSTTWR